MHTRVPTRPRTQSHVQRSLERAVLALLTVEEKTEDVVQTPSVIPSSPSLLRASRSQTPSRTQPFLAC